MADGIAALERWLIAIKAFLKSKNVTAFITPVNDISVLFNYVVIILLIGIAIG